MVALPIGDVPELDGALTFAGSEAEIVREATLPVRACLATATDAAGARRLRWHGDRTIGEHAPVVPSEWRAWAALSLSAAGPLDVRPHLLALVRWQHASELDVCIAYGCAYLAAWCARMGRRTQRADVLRVAAIDALALVYHGRITRGVGRPTVAARAKALHIASDAFGRLRKCMAEVYGWRLQEAMARYAAANDDKPLANGQYHGNGFSHRTLWRPEHALPGPLQRLHTPISPWSRVRAIASANADAPSSHRAA